MPPLINRKHEGKSPDEREANKLVKRHTSILDCLAFLLRGFIKRQGVPVNPVCGVFLAEIHGNDDQVYAADATKTLDFGILGHDSRAPIVAVDSSTYPFNML